jgi:hypothetical protein
MTLSRRKKGFGWKSVRKIRREETDHPFPPTLTKPSTPHSSLGWLTPIIEYAGFGTVADGGSLSSRLLAEHF